MSAVAQVYLNACMLYMSRPADVLADLPRFLELPTDRIFKLLISTYQADIHVSHSVYALAPCCM